MLNGLKNELICVRGNCEAEVDQMVLEFPVLADFSMLFVNGRTIYVTHGHVQSFDNLPTVKSADIFLQGHTHVPKCLKDDGILCLNPGSVSIPKENSPHSYMIFDENGFVWKSLDDGEVYMQCRL